MNRTLALTLAGTALWALGAVWYYDCKIKRVCGPENTLLTTAPDATPAAQPQAASPRVTTPAAPPEAAVVKAPAAAVSGPQRVLTVSFDARSSAVLPPEDAAARLATLKAGIAEGRKVLVLGHSDGRGARARIAIVSLQRAQALRDWLLLQGIPASAIAAVESREDREPVASNNREDGRRLNRRAEAVLTAKE